jgi:hypothetical protein
MLVEGANRITHPVVALFVKHGVGELRLAPVAGCHAWPSSAAEAAGAVSLWLGYRWGILLVQPRDNLRPQELTTDFESGPGSHPKTVRSQDFGNTLAGCFFAKSRS